MSHRNVPECDVGDYVRCVHRLPAFGDYAPSVGHPPLNPESQSSCFRRFHRRYGQGDLRV
jgi:hypothetical protein